MPDRLVSFTLALWWGALTVIGFIVVPLLFSSLPSPQMAGQTAAKLFTVSCYVALGCGCLLLILTRSEKWRTTLRWLYDALPWLVLAMLLAALIEFAIAPRILIRENIKWWHTLGSSAYFLQWVAVSVLLWRQPRGV